jgi:tripartite-type tricarboxylate transporter receptor subunit TctC
MRCEVRVLRSIAGLLVSAIVFAAAPAHAYPDRPINMIVPWGVGGGGDRVGRIMAGLMAAKLGVSVPVINVPGAASQVGLNKALGEPADGYNVIEITSDSYILFAAANAKFKVSDFTALAVVDQQPSGFFVREDSPFKSWADVVQAAKSRSVTVAGSGFGTQSDVTVNYFDTVQGFKFVSVPFDDPGLRWNSLLGGHADLLYAQFGDLISYLKSKQLRPILAFAENRLPDYPAIPTVSEFNYRINITHFRAFAVKQGTGQPQYAALVSAMNTASQSPDYKKMLADEAAVPDSFIAGSAAQSYVQNWVAQLRALIAKDGVKDDAKSGEKHGG